MMAAARYQAVFFAKRFAFRRWALNLWHTHALQTQTASPPAMHSSRLAVGRPFPLAQAFGHRQLRRALAVCVQILRSRRGMKLAVAHCRRRALTLAAWSWRKDSAHWLVVATLVGRAANAWRMYSLRRAVGIMSVVARLSSAAYGLLNRRTFGRRRSAFVIWAARRRPAKWEATRALLEKVMGSRRHAIFRAWYARTARHTHIFRLMCYRLAWRSWRRRSVSRNANLFLTLKADAAPHEHRCALRRWRRNAWCRSTAARLLAPTGAVLLARRRVAWRAWCDKATRYASSREISHVSELAEARMANACRAAALARLREFAASCARAHQAFEAGHKRRVRSCWLDFKEGCLSRRRLLRDVPVQLARRRMARESHRRGMTKIPSLGPPLSGAMALLGKGLDAEGRAQVESRSLRRSSPMLLRRRRPLPAARSETATVLLVHPSDVPARQFDASSHVMYRASVQGHASIRDTGLLHYAPPLLAFAVSYTWRSGWEVRLSLAAWRQLTYLLTQIARLQCMQNLRRLVARVAAARRHAEVCALAERLAYTTDSRRVAAGLNAFTANAFRIESKCHGDRCAAAFRWTLQSRALLQRLAERRERECKLAAATRAITAYRRRTGRAAALRQWRQRRLAVPARALGVLCRRARLARGLCCVAHAALEHRSAVVRAFSATVASALNATAAAFAEWRRRIANGTVSFSPRLTTAAVVRPLRMRMHAFRLWSQLIARPDGPTRAKAAAWARRKELSRFLLALREAEAEGWARRFRQLATLRLVRSRHGVWLREATGRWREWATARHDSSVMIYRTRLRTLWVRWNGRLVARRLLGAWALVSHSLDGRRCPLVAYRRREQGDKCTPHADRTTAPIHLLLSYHVYVRAIHRACRTWHIAATERAWTADAKVMADMHHKQCVFAMTMGTRSKLYRRVSQERIARASAISTHFRRLRPSFNLWKGRVHVAIEAEANTIRRCRLTATLRKWRRQAVLRLRLHQAAGGATASRLSLIRGAFGRLARHQVRGQQRVLQVAWDIYVAMAEKAAFTRIYEVARRRAHLYEAAAGFIAGWQRPAMIRQALGRWAQAVGHWSKLRWIIPLGRVMLRRHAYARAMRGFAASLDLAYLRDSACRAMRAIQVRRTAAALSILHKAARVGMLRETIAAAAEHTRRFHLLRWACRQLVAYAGRNRLRRHTGHELGLLAASVFKRAARRSSLRHWRERSAHRSRTAGRLAVHSHLQHEHATSAAVRKLAMWASARRRFALSLEVAASHARLGSLLSTLSTLSALARAAARAHRQRQELSRHARQAAIARAVCAWRRLEGKSSHQWRLLQSSARLCANVVLQNRWLAVFERWASNTAIARAHVSYSTRQSALHQRSAFRRWLSVASRHRVDAELLELRRKALREADLQVAVATLYLNAKRALRVATLNRRHDRRRRFFVMLREYTHSSQTREVHRRRASIAERYWAHRMRLLALCRLRRHALIAPLLTADVTCGSPTLAVWQAVRGMLDDDFAWNSK